MTSQGLLLINLGSPDSYAVEDVRSYLKEFLMDGKVIDIPYPLRKIIVEGFIVPFRSKKSAEAYRSIWTEEGSPLKAITDRFCAMVRQKLNMPVVVAMRYANPTPASAVEKLLEENPGINEVLVAPLYPHYAMSSYETALEHVLKEVKSKMKDATIRVLQPFFRESGYINALHGAVAPYLKKFDHILFSYHGLPVRHLKKTDPTHQHCMKMPDCCDHISVAWNTCYRHQALETVREVAHSLNLKQNQYSVSFQSRLGKDTWLMPFTESRLKELPSEGIKKLLVVCPAFVADCLETLEEIAERGKETFLHAGGESFTLVPCLNTQPAWVDFFVDCVKGAHDRFMNNWSVI